MGFENILLGMGEAQENGEVLQGEQGINGPPYKIFYGNLKEMVGMVIEARSRPMELSHRIIPRLLPFFYHTVEDYVDGTAFYASCSDLVSKWRKLTSKESCEVDVRPAYELNRDAISRTKIW
ncbi:hypothetical protein IFM89_023157 [Coptis chinensis]|uniref:Uncharacterized protein n=1 Tax=Coptis chinensis TaxID=261450 RepID=A0A835IU06_9MAGN|nr:hypothetical protein IFM89_023157 [Coptis chinensis]